MSIPPMPSDLATRRLSEDIQSTKQGIVNVARELSETRSHIRRAIASGTCIGSDLLREQILSSDLLRLEARLTMLINDRP